ncbi:tachykinin-4 [Engraulis encrasicolus]|uniref:tachykinin-4 n=1 Tax=Engraulis encrasicolus TaxID=184585 RepID=UPI002FD6274D
MLNIEMAKLAVLAVILYVQVEGSFGSLEDDRDIWSLESWQEDPSDSGVAMRIADLMKRSKSHQFHGLMGRSSDVQPVRLGRKRNKGEMFVGLMGRRSSSGEVQREWEKPPNYY